MWPDKGARFRPHSIRHPGEDRGGQAGGWLGCVEWLGVGGCWVLVDAPPVKLTAPPIDEPLPRPRPRRLLKFGCFREGGDRSWSSFRCSEAATDSFTAGVAALIVLECLLCRNEKFSEAKKGHQVFSRSALWCHFSFILSFGSICWSG